MGQEIAQSRTRLLILSHARGTANIKSDHANWVSNGMSHRLELSNWRKLLVWAPKLGQLYSRTPEKSGELTNCQHVALIQRVRQ